MMFFVKVIYLWFLDLPLSFDESYYWDWSRHPDWGYFSKPPMVAWVIGLSTKILGVSEFAVRFPAVLSISISGVFFYLLVRKYITELQLKIFYVLSFFAIPILTVYSFIMTIDPLLICFWIGAIYFLSNFIEKEDTINALLTGLFVGLGLLVKQTMVVFLLFSFIYFLFFRKEVFKKIQFYYIFFIPMIMILPNIYWNYTHEFVMFKHTEEHFSREGFSILKGLKLIGEVTVLHGPIILLFFVKFFKDLKTIKAQNGLFGFLYLNGFFLLLLWIVSFFIELNVNWMLPFGISVFIYLMLMGTKNLSFIKKLNFLFCLFFSLTILIFGYKPDKFPDKAQEVLKKFRGWRELAVTVERIHDRSIPIVTSSRDIASSLAFYLSYHPKVYVIRKKPSPENQYHIWRDDRDLWGREVLWVQRGEKFPSHLRDPVMISHLKVKISKDLERVFSIWKGVWENRYRH